MSSVNRDYFTFFFSIGILFISFSCPIAPAKTSSIMFNSNGTSGQPCLIRDLREKAFGQSLIIKYDVSCGYKDFVLPRKALRVPAANQVCPQKGCHYKQRERFLV